jgi:hypothetical protein
MKYLFVLTRLLISLLAAFMLTGTSMVYIQGIFGIPIMSCVGVDCTIDPIHKIWPIIVFLILSVLLFKLINSLKFFIVSGLLVLVFIICVSLFFMPFTLNKDVGPYKGGRTLFGISTNVILRDFQEGDYVLYKRENFTVEWLGWVDSIPEEGQYKIRGIDDFEITLPKEKIDYLIIFP